MNNGKVCIVTVTYGNRIHLLKEVLASINKEMSVHKIIIVNNGSKIDEINKMNIRPEIQIIDLKENTGSANAFNLGLKEAIISECDYIMTIDDDNLPEKGCIKNLLNYYMEISKVTGNKIALLAYREDRLDFKKMAEGSEINNAFSLNDSFLGWDLGKIPFKIYNKLFARNNDNQLKENNFVDYTKVPIAPYGGLFFHKSLLKIIGFPNEHYFLYCDDYDFTFRINKFANGIYLIPSSKIIDIDKTWFVKEKHGFIMSFMTSNSSFRIFYGIRNRVYFETRNLVNNRFKYYLNKISFIMIIFLLSVLMNKNDRFMMIMKAIKNGNKGILGKEPNIG
ncbi:GT2 family glycosyltransferase [Neobacillus sp. B4I6]|uniref:glycosyltransferase n=1 Tax=Neobacillus sp. B4I6 TaxID=3373925 RepID=UPI003D1CA995